MTTDHILDHAPSRGVDVDTFRARERKRVELLQVRLETERELLTLENELSTLRHNREQANGKVQREWIFWRWLRPVAPAPTPPDITPEGGITDIDQAIQTSRAALEERLEKLDTTVRTLNAQVRAWMPEGDGRMRAALSQGDFFQEQVRPLDSSLSQATPRSAGELKTQREQGSSAHGERTHHPEEQGRVTTLRAPMVTEEQGTAATVILAAYQHLGVATSDNRIAREVGYSRKTVARWKKRFLEQGRLSVAPNADQQQPLPQEMPEQAR